MNAPKQQSDLRRVAITVRGVVQGVGFRPFVYNAARAEGLSGWVRNETDRVQIELAGTADAVERFVEALRHRPPPAARIESIDVEPLPFGESSPGGEFRIETSDSDAAPRPTIPADLATCADCLAEVRDPTERRHRYPFTNCTACGPRWSIIQGLPYDRPRTSMAGFAMCADCRREYEDPTDRRFHAQPIACPRCGPQLELLDSQGQTLAGRDEALRRAVAAVAEGKIVAIKGLGGFQLVCDATNDEAVATLRRRKRRPDRPFALMMRSLDEARSYCRCPAEEAAVLASAESPIVLLRRTESHEPARPLARDGGRGLGCAAPESQHGDHHASEHPISPAVAPGNPDLGVMLPYTPLHHLLMDAVGRPIVCTSGNLADEPMAIETDEALRRLGRIADMVLTHDRPIVRPVDDSVVRVDDEGLQLLRRARGYAPRPLPLRLGNSTDPGEPALPGPILAVGGHLKNAIALALPGEPNIAVVGSHLGDLDTVPSVELHRRAIDDLLAFFDVSPAAIVGDLHPDYASTREAERRVALLASSASGRMGTGETPAAPNDSASGAPPSPAPLLLRVQHHHAHVAAVMAEHGLPGPVLGLAWDGTGYGTDGTVWGGELLLCEAERCQRIGHLRPFALPGGDRATREPRRSALGLLWEFFEGDRQAIAPRASAWFDGHELDLLLTALERGVNCPRASSMGRLFDAVAALAGLPPVISFEGQAAMALEFAAAMDESSAYELPLVESCATGVSPLQGHELGHSPVEERRSFGTPPSRDSHGAMSASLGAASQHPSTQHSNHRSPISSDQSPLVVDWRPMIERILADLDADVPPGVISARFHRGLAELASAAARRVDLSHVALTGGCFQNALLTRLCRERLMAEGFRVYTARLVPPGDGGVALGQLAVAAHYFAHQTKGR